MAKSDSYQQRAAEFLKLWQDQMTQQMNNPDTIRAMLAAMQSFGAAHDANPRHAADAPDARTDAIRLLTKRLDAVERELAKLHARMDAPQKPPGAGKRSRAKPVAKHGRTVDKAKRAIVKRKPGKPVAKSGKRKK